MLGTANVNFRQLCCINFIVESLCPGCVQVLDPGLGLTKTPVEASAGP